MQPTTTAVRVLTVVVAIASAMGVDCWAPALAQGVPPAGAPPAPAVAPSQSAKAAERPWEACSRLTDPIQLAALVKAAELLRHVWLEAQGTHVARYTMPGEVRNPFDLTPKAPDSGPRDGFAQARPPLCTARVSPAGDMIEVRYTTPFYRFYEVGPGWSVTLRNGILLETTVQRSGDQWVARDTSPPTAILLPEQKPSRPGESDMPADAPWAPPVPPCRKSERWTGEACLKRQR